MLPTAGSVLGVDVGWSPQRRSSAVCRLDWDERTIGWTIMRFRASPEERRRAVDAVVGQRHLQAAAFDGPFCGDLSIIGRYREAERALTRRSIRDRIGKPGQSSSPTGRLLNEYTNYCVRAVLRHPLNDAAHWCAVHHKAVVEAFPNAFLGLLLEQPETIAALRGDRSDVYFSHLAGTGVLRRLLQHFLPDRACGDLGQITNHDDRAALVCALTALCIAGGDFTAVGDADGWIILPPRTLLAEWAIAALSDE